MVPPLNKIPASATDGTGQVTIKDEIKNTAI